MKSRRGCATLIWSRDCTREEAAYILHLDSLYTFSEVSSYLLGVHNPGMGMQLVKTAEQKLPNGIPPSLNGASRHTKLNGHSSGQEQSDDPAAEDD